ncbi:hypothetical protein A2W14_04195 [Candidatus Gottesmanbacteria bacterium RBG_16_37_8]|uniref:Uncharacterized protein n=1 Tax=Candidatus Gottesmanbacteria bacterium RBG_16_37_8 TaxID=1798371 RepID=A0A1F5YPE9_9BACT|nr:MAG: hypothetical protein A2W14_04195 [Candidatus Gottesmanbacteria bacterium RBG_16_37_8]
MKQDPPIIHLGILILLFLIAINLLILDIKIFYPKNLLFSDINSPTSQVESTSGITQSSSSDTVSAALSEILSKDQKYCPLACVDLIGQATGSSNIGSPQQSAPTVSQQTSATKEFIIPLGQGQTAKNNWEDIIGTETVINPALYGQIKEAYFIASLKNPTKNGQVEARLFNVTDSYAVYGSHVIMNNQTEQTISSEKFALPSSSKLLRVQLKSTLGYSATLENARLKILAN